MEVVPSSSPFGRVLKDHNLRERRPPTTAPAASKSQTNLQKTLQELVREHLRSSISACNENSINSNQSTNLRTNNGNGSKSSSVSCLVQKWRGFETHHPDQQQVPNPPDSDDQIQNQESVTATRINSLESDNDDSISDWESDQAPIINECPAGGNGDDEVSEIKNKKKKIRVVDIMRKLPLKVPLGQLECEGLRSPPRIRGRQAIADLLSRLARDRYDEVEALARCQAVSKFPKRGHIKSLLKFRLLRGQSSAHSHRHHQPPKAQEFSKAIQQRLTSVNSLRRRFSKGQSELNDLASTLNQTSIAAEATKENSRQEEINLCQISDETPEHNNQEETRIEAVSQCQEEVKILDGEVKYESKNQQQNEEEEEEENFDTPRSNASTEIVLQDSTTLEVQNEDPTQEMVLKDDTAWKESGSDEEEADFHYDTPEKTHNLSRDVWEEDYREEIVHNEEYYDDNDFFESSLDWIHDISRPHSYWESRRQAWYQEIFESSTNNDIRRLIERGSVSAVLASDFRDRMDQLMTSNVQLQMHIPIDSGDNEGLSRVAFLQTKMQSKSFGSLVEEEEEEQNQENEHCHEREVEAMSEEHVDVNRDIKEEEDEDCNKHEQTPLMEEEENEDYNNEQTPLMELPWSSYQDQEDKGADLEQIESATHHQESFVTISYDHDSQVGSSVKNGSTIEMELISDIRAHMQQMYNEMSELRKAVNGCTEMQSKLQSSIREEVSAAISHINGKESKRKAPKKGSCRICHKKKADSLFYRCGHMCTCFECAHELQWSSGKCPVCWAEIVDVVRVCTDYY
ncbi:hypothetical protein V2J09_002283 [Rumex salicifolius]